MHNFTVTVEITVPQLPR